MMLFKSAGPQATAAAAVVPSRLLSSVGISLALLLFLPYDCAVAVDESSSSRDGFKMADYDLPPFLSSHSTPLLHDEDIYKFLDGVLSVTTSSSNSNSTTFGYTDIPHKIPMSEDSHFPIASNSKLYTTVAIYQLHEEGKILDLDADIATMLDPQDFENFGLPKSTRFCPRLLANSWFPWTKCEIITLRHLLSMSSGIYPALNCNAPDPSALFHLHPRCHPDPYFVNRGSIAKTVGTFLLKPLMFRPGTSYHYSNPNFILAAYFVEKYSGMTFRDYLTANIFDRMGLNHTYFDFFNGAMGLDPQRVGQYVRYYDETTHELLSVGADVLQLDLGAASGTGGIISTLQDQATFWHTLFDKTTKGAPLISEASQKDILYPWNLVQEAQWQWPNGTAFPVWIYYTQGTVIVCDAPDEKCSAGPDHDHLLWIMYTGGTITVHTANLLDYRSMKMVQVWTSSLVAMLDAKTFQSAFDAQTGLLFRVVGPWIDMKYNNPMALAFAKMNEDYCHDQEEATGAEPQQLITVQE